MISFCYGFWVVFQMDEYLPWRVRLIRGIELSVVAHLGLVLASSEWRSWIRWIIAILILPSMVGMAVLWWYFSIPVLVWQVWRIVRLIQGGSRDDESV